ncbi:MAG: tRNA (adenosine(37)-N6)-dimethylallyltransferase MiaA [Deltaproteobacteria bacterium]|nr:tRNA (adenosine(37)-N6)-dimethylallyltransferase MiaA [Deltaproteobacteria bacterium]
MFGNEMGGAGILGAIMAGSAGRSVEIDIPVLVISGPTASGKTGVAIELAKRYGFELVGADSMQVYRGMDIGTDTPTATQLGGVTHHLINVVNPDEEYDAARFAKDADSVIADIHKRGRRALIVGGTGLYLRVLLNGLQSGPPPNAELREELNQKARHQGWPALHSQLKIMDPEAFERLHPNDGVRIVRALEVYLQTGKPLSEWQKEHGFSQKRYPHLIIGISRPKEELNERINRRVDEMFQMGLIEEVKTLLEKGYDSSLKPMQALGYKPVNEYICGDISLDQAIENTKTTTRRFAKRQRTWFRKEEDIVWTPPSVEAVIAAADEWLP